MNASKYVRTEELLESIDSGPFEINPSPLAGQWIKTNATPGLPEVIVARRGDDGWLQVFYEWSR